jgi:glutaredoxin 3
MAAVDGSSVARLASQRAVVIFAASNCFMCHAVKTLLSDLGVSWTVYELDKEPRGKDMESALAGMVGGRNPQVPAVFIGGKLVGPTDQVMALHLGGKLVPLLREAGALWL